MPLTRSNRLRHSLLLVLATSTPGMAAEHVTIEGLARRLQALEQRLDATTPADAKPVGADLVSLDQRLRVLERKLELQADETAARAAVQPVVNLDAKGLSVKSAPGDIEVKFRGLVQADTRSYFSDTHNPQNDTFMLRRAEPTIEGTWGSLRLRGRDVQGRRARGDAADEDERSGAVRARGAGESGRRAQ